MFTVSLFIDSETSVTCYCYMYSSSTNVTLQYLAMLWLTNEMHRQHVYLCHLLYERLLHTVIKQPAERANCAVNTDITRKMLLTNKPQKTMPCCTKSQQTFPYCTN